MVAAARLMILQGHARAYAAASVAADATTEAMAQVVFLAFGLGVGLTHFRHLARVGAADRSHAGGFAAGGAGHRASDLLAEEGRELCRKDRRAVLPARSKEGVSFPRRDRGSLRFPPRLAASRRLHLLAWIGGGRAAPSSPSAWSADISALLNAVALEALLCTLRSIAAPVPAAIGRAGMRAMPCWRPCSGCRRKWALAVSLLKRATRDRDGRAGAALLAKRGRPRGVARRRGVMS